MRFRRTASGVETDPDPVEAALLRSLVEDLLTLLGSGPEPSQDPLEAALGLPAEDTGLPADPALARLFPDGYPDDDTPDAAQANRDFRRYTESDLRAGKRADCTTVLTTIPTGGETSSRHRSRVRLDPAQARAWMGCLNDLRLVLGTTLEVTDDTDLDDGADPVDADDPRTHALQVYGWLGWLQESLVSCLMPR